MDKKPEISEQLRALVDIGRMTVENPDPVDLDELLAFDPLDAVEKATGVSYKEPGQEMAGLSVAFAHNKKRIQELERRGDTSHVTLFTTHLDLAVKAGFKVIYSYTFEDDRREPSQIDHLVVLFDATRGALLKLESYGDKVNSANVYFNWRPSVEYMERKGGSPWPPCQGSGGFDPVDPNADRHDTSLDIRTDFAYVGYKDVREAFLHTLKQLDENGEWVTPWVARPFLWLLTYMDSKVDGYDHQAITAERVALFPEDVQEAIRGR